MTKINLERVFKRLFFTLLSIKALESLTIFSHGDALNYHLVIGRLVTEESWSNVFSTFFPVFLSGYFEVLYILPNLLFGNTLMTQLSGQFLHFSFSLLLPCLLFRKYFKNPLYGYLAGIILLTLSKGGDFLLYAKNDGALAALCLWLSLMIFTLEKEKWSWVKFGLLFGIVPSIKLSGVFVLIPLFGYICFHKYKEPKFILGIIALSLGIYFPNILIKHHYLGGAILFPALLKTFPGNLPETTIRLFTGFISAKPTFDSLWANTKFLLFSKVFLVCFFPFFIYHFKDKFSKIALLMIGTSFSLAMLINGGMYSERFLFPVFFLQVALLALGLQSKEVPKKILVFSLLVLLADSKIDKSIKRVAQLPKLFTTNHKELRLQNVPLSRVWEHMRALHADKHTYVLSDNFAQTFYSDKGIRLDNFPSEPRTSFFKKCEDPTKLQKYDYFIMKWGFDTPCNAIIKQTSELIFKQDSYSIFKRKSL